MTRIETHGKSNKIYFFSALPIAERGTQPNRVYAITKFCKTNEKVGHHHLLHLGYYDSSNPLPDLPTFIEKGATHISYYQPPDRSAIDEIIADIKDNYEFGVEH
jgi:hypothetical protein